MSARRKPNASVPTDADVLPLTALPASTAAMAAEAVRANLDIFEANLRALRAIADASREALRQQQDTILAAWRGQLEQSAGQTSMFAASPLAPPFAAMLNAYMQGAQTVLNAQRRNGEDATASADAVR